VAFECALEWVCMERDANPIQAEAAQQDFHTRMYASSSRSKHSISLNRMLKERQILLCLLETDLEVQEAMQAEEQEHNLHPFDGRDLLAELEGLCTRMDGVEGEHATEAGQLL
jgi:hypothetical protein